MYGSSRICDLSSDEWTHGRTALMNCGYDGKYKKSEPLDFY